MSEKNKSRKYESFRIPERKFDQRDGDIVSYPKTDAKPMQTPPDGTFYEIEYDSCPFPGVGKFVLKPHKIEEPEKDEKRELFGRMRDIARAHRARYDFFSRSFERDRNNDAAVFYEQGMFMKDVTDDYKGNAEFSQYFPSYQMMGYEQLRTYFTFRTEVRKGNVSDTSLSYAFLYIYELLGNIGVANPQEGLDKLMFFWKSFSLYNKTIDKYVLRWLKDYHIYYELPQSFKEFAEKNNLTEHYPKMTESNDSFGLFCAISKYDIRKSNFFSDETKKMISDCFSFVLDRIRHDFESAGMHFDDALFRPVKKINKWQPFKNALFYDWLKQQDKRIVLSENEIYICKNNAWFFSTIITTEKGRQFIGYIMKKMEAVLRTVTKYKFKITADINMVHAETLRKLNKAGLFIDEIIFTAVTKFYKEKTKTIVTIDHASLARIRHEAQITQEALIVEEQTVQKEAAPFPVIFSAQDQNLFADSFEVEPEPVSDVWAKLKDILNENEIKALSVILRGGDAKTIADQCGIMLEVLIDGINEKATDCIGDNLTDEEFTLYEDYKEQIKELIR